MEYKLSQASGTEGNGISLVGPSHLLMRPTSERFLPTLVTSSGSH